MGIDEKQPVDSVLPCPFCGRAPEMKSRTSILNESGMIYFIVCFCGGCSARAHIASDTKEQVLTEWNTRHDLNTQDEPQR